MKAFVAFARTFMRALAEGDYGAAVARLDAADDGYRWKKADLLRELAVVASEPVSLPDGRTKSAEPTLDEVVAGEVFILHHRLPVRGQWSDGEVSFRFERSKGQYFRVVLMGFRRAAGT